MKNNPSCRKWHLTVVGVPTASQWVSVSVDSGFCGGGRLRFAVQTDDSVYYGYGVIAQL